MSLRNDIMRISVLGFRSDIRIELQAPVLYPPSTAPFYANVSKGAASTIFYTSGMVRSGFEPTTSRSDSGRSTN